MSAAALAALHRAGAAQRARRRSSRRAAGRDLTRALASLPATLARWSERQRERRRLRTLAQDPHFLDDLGLSRAEALREADKPFWRD